MLLFGNIVYRKRNFSVIKKSSKEFIVINTHNHSHSHMSTFKGACTVIDLYLRNKKAKSDYIQVAIERLK